MNILKILATLVTAIILVGCGHSNSYIKKAYNELDRGIAESYKKYADFSPEQEERIDDIALEMMAWHRTKKLPEIYQLINTLSNELNNTGQIKSNSLKQTLILFSDPLPFTESDAISEQFALFVLDTSDEQIEQIIQSVKEEEQFIEAILKTQNVEKQAKEVSKSIKGAFKEIGISLPRGTLKKIRRDLLALTDMAPKQIIANKDWNTDFVTILEQRNIVNKEEFVSIFVEHWRQSESIFKQADENAWAANQELIVQILEETILSLSDRQREKAIAKLNRYSNIVGELISEGK
jgi:uncharacterized protein YueI